MRYVSSLLALLLALPVSPAAAQEPPRLNLTVVEGEGAINNVRQRLARETIVQVDDENHRPVAGAAVVFTLPSQGASGTFANGARSLTVISDNQGRAVARGLRPNNVQGKFEIRVTASQNGRTGSTTISQTNVVAAAGAGAAAGGISAKLIAIIAVAGAAVAGGVVAGTRGGNDSQTPTSTTITAGTGSVGPPR